MVIPTLLSSVSRAYVAAIQTKAAPVSTEAEEPLKLTAQVVDISIILDYLRISRYSSYKLSTDI